MARDTGHDALGASCQYVTLRATIIFPPLSQKSKLASPMTSEHADIPPSHKCRKASRILMQCKLSLTKYARAAMRDDIFSYILHGTICRHGRQDARLRYFGIARKHAIRHYTRYAMLTALAARHYHLYEHTVFAVAIMNAPSAIRSSLSMNAARPTMRRKATAGHFYYDAFMLVATYADIILRHVRRPRES